MKNQKIEMKIEFDKKTKSISVHGHNNKKRKTSCIPADWKIKIVFEWIFKNDLVDSERKQIKIQLKSWWNEFCKINWKYSLLVKIWSCGGISDGKQ